MVSTFSASLQCRRWLALDASLMLLLLLLSLVAWLVHQACTCAFRRTFFAFAGDCMPSLGLLSSLLPSVFQDFGCVQKMLRCTLFSCLQLFANLKRRGNRQVVITSPSRYATCFSWPTRDQ